MKTGYAIAIRAGIVFTVILVSGCACSTHPKSDWMTYTSTNLIHDLAFDRDGNLWVASTGGVVRWDITALTSIKYTIDDGLPGNGVSSIAVTVDNRVWVGISDKGVACFDGQTWTSYTELDGLANNQVHSIAASPDGTVWFGTDGGVSHFDGQTWNSYTELDGLANNEVRSVALTPNGTLWAGTWGGGVSRFDGQTWTTYTTADGLMSDTVYSIASVSDDALWFCTIEGLSFFDGEHWINRFFPMHPFGITDSIAITSDDVVWVGTKYDGVFRFEGADWADYGVADGLADSLVGAVSVAPDGTLWFGTGRGISHLSGEKWTTLANTAEPAGNRIQSIATASDGTVWFGTGGGVSRTSMVRPGRRILSKMDWPRKLSYLSP